MNNSQRTAKAAKPQAHSKLGAMTRSAGIGRTQAAAKHERPRRTANSIGSTVTAVGRVFQVRFGDAQLAGAVLGALGAFVLLVGLGNGPLHVYDEGLYGMYGRTMLH